MSSADQLAEMFIFKGVDRSALLELCTMAPPVSFETGVVRVMFGKRVADTSLTAAEKSESWYDAAAVDDDGMIWRPTQIIPSTARFNAVVLTTLPHQATHAPPRWPLHRRRSSPLRQT